jgi:hypothetical protein
MEFLDLLHLVVVANLPIFIAAAFVFVFLQRRWSLMVHGDALQQKEKTIILPPFWAARPVSLFAFAESKLNEKTIISQRRRFDLLLAAMPEKILDQVMAEVDNIIP